MDKLKQVLSGSDSPDEERSGIIPQVIQRILFFFFIEITTVFACLVERIHNVQLVYARHRFFGVFHSGHPVIVFGLICPVFQ